VLRLSMCGAVPPLFHVFLARCLIKNMDNFTFGQLNERILYYITLSTNSKRASDNNSESVIIFLVGF
jgi:hypothetical protein